MKKLFIVCIACCLLTRSSAQTFRNYIGKEAPQEYGYNVSEAADSSYLVSAKYTNEFFGTAFPALISASKNGNVAWAKEIKISNLPSVYSTWVEAVKTRSGKPDGSIVLIDAWKSFYLVRLKKDGTVLWAKKCSQPNYFTNSGKIVKPIYDINSTLTGFLILGNHYGNDGSFLIKTDITGATVWQKKFKHIVATGSYWLNDMKVTTDGGCVITGSQGGTNVSTLSIVIKVSSSGSISWAKSYQFNAEKNCYANSIAVSNDGYVVTGSQASNNNLTFKIKTDGTITWSNIYKTTDGTVSYTAGLSITTDASGNIIVAGSTDNAANNKPAIITKLSSAGGVLFAKKFIAELSYYNATINNIIVTSSGNYCAAGTSAPANATADIYLANVSTLGNISASCRPTSFVLTSSSTPQKTSASALPSTTNEVLINAAVSASTVNISTQNDQCGSTVSSVHIEENTTSLTVSNDVAGNQLLINFKSSTKELFGNNKAILINNFGQAVHSISINPNKPFFMPMQNMSTGMYSVAIINNGKLVIQEKAFWVK